MAAGRTVTAGHCWETFAPTEFVELVDSGRFEVAPHRGANEVTSTLGRVTETAIGNVRIRGRVRDSRSSVARPRARPDAPPLPRRGEWSRTPLPIDLGGIHRDYHARGRARLRVQVETS